MREFRIKQDGMVVAGACGETASAVAMRYAGYYQAEGDVTVQEKINGRWNNHCKLQQITDPRRMTARSDADRVAEAQALTVARPNSRSKCADVWDADLSNVPDSPEIIWLQWGDNGGDDDTWCANRIDDEDVPYVRADLVSTQAHDTIRDLLAVIEAQRERMAALWLLLREGTDFLQVESDALKDGIGVAGEWEANVCPEDQPTIEAIREIEGWIAKVSDMQPRAALGETP